MVGGSRTLPQFLVRMPDRLKAWVAQQAAQNRRSMNSEIVYRLEAAMAAEATPPASAGGVPAAGKSLES